MVLTVQACQWVAEAAEVDDDMVEWVVVAASAAAWVEAVNQAVWVVWEVQSQQHQQQQLTTQAITADVVAAAIDAK